MKYIFILLVLISLALISCTPDNPVTIQENLTCSSDSDCVPSQCCHATSCINQDYKKPCNLLCTQECRPGTLDCNKGSCQCVNNQCKAEINSKENTKIPNPASVYCEEHGNKLEIRSNPDGSQYGVCILQNNTECDEWKYFRGEC